VESSHCYPRQTKFFSEVARVLKPKGHFLYADFRGRGALDGWQSDLQSSGLTIVAKTDITASVLRALDLDDQRKHDLLERALPPLLHSSVKDFAAFRGSKMYEGFRSGSLAYFSFVARKTIDTSGRHA
jgi:hypothetical protein